MLKKILIPKIILYPLILVLTLTILRVILFGKYSLIYILWNIFLAIIPFILSSILLHLKEIGKLRNLTFVILGIFWLLFLPNAPYIVTDLIHIGVVKSVPVLFDSILLFSSAFVGFMLGLYSLNHIENILSSLYSKKVTLFIVLLIIFLTSFGMYLGRFLRFNSWDIIIDPLSLSGRFLETLSSSGYHVESLIYIPLFFIFICSYYFSWKKSYKN